MKPPEGTQTSADSFVFLIGKLHPIKFGRRNNLPFQVALDIKYLTKQNPDRSCVIESISFLMYFAFEATLIAVWQTGTKVNCWPTRLIRPPLLI